MYQFSALGLLCCGVWWKKKSCIRHVCHEILYAKVQHFLIIFGPAGLLNCQLADWYLGGNRRWLPASQAWRQAWILPTEAWNWPLQRGMEAILLQRLYWWLFTIRLRWLWWQREQLSQFAGLQSRLSVAQQNTRWLDPANHPGLG